MVMTKEKNTKEVVISARITADIAECLNRYCKKEDRTPSHVVCKVVTDFVRKEARAEQK